MKKTLFLLSTFSIFIVNCKELHNYTTTQSGLEYIIVKENPYNKKPEVNDYLILSLKLYLNDSLFFDSRAKDLKFRFQHKNPNNKGKIYEGLSMLHINDSAILRISAIDFLNNNSSIPTPECISNADKLTFYIKLIGIISPEQIELEKERQIQKKIENENKQLQNYLNQNGINVKQEKSGIYVIKEENGFGQKPNIGDTIYTDYCLSLINGVTIESTDRPFSFIHGDTTLIRGWTKAVSMMRKGEQATIIIPSDMAYGDKGFKNIIPPYSTIILHLSIVDIKRKIGKKESKTIIYNLNTADR